MKLKQINSEQDVITYIEGCYNDHITGEDTQNEFLGYIIELIIHLINLDRAKRDKEKPIKKVVENGYQEMVKDGTLDKINKSMKTFEDNKSEIYQQIIDTANELFVQGLFTEACNYLDRFRMVPDEEILKRYA